MEMARTNRPASYSKVIIFNSPAYPELEVTKNPAMSIIHGYLLAAMGPRFGKLVPGRQH